MKAGLMLFICSLFLTTHTEFLECCVCFKCLTQLFCTRISDLVHWWFHAEKWRIWMQFVVFLCSPSRSSWVSVVFDFNASINDVAPVSPSSLSDDWIKTEESELLIVPICVFFFFFSFLLCSQLRFSPISVVFVLSASLNDFAPISPMLFSE